MGTDVDWADLVRGFTLVVLVLTAFEMLMMMAYYRQSILPKRRKIAEGEILAPPAGWTFAYHVMVLGLLCVLIVTRYQLIRQDAPANLITYVQPIPAVAMLVVIGKFQNYYGQNLRRAERKRDGPTFPA